MFAPRRAHGLIFALFAVSHIACTTTSVVTVRHRGQPYDIRTLQGSNRQPRRVQRGPREDLYHLRHQHPDGTRTMFLASLVGIGVCGALVFAAIAVPTQDEGAFVLDTLDQIGVGAGFLGTGLGLTAIASGVTWAAQKRPRVGFVPRRTSPFLTRDDLELRRLGLEEAAVRQGAVERKQEVGGAVEGREDREVPRSRERRPDRK